MLTENNFQGQEIKTLRSLCLLGGFSAPIITLVWELAYPDLICSELAASLFSGVFFVIYFLSYKNNYVRKNVLSFLGVVLGLISIFGLYFAYLNKFSEDFPYLFFIIILVATLVFKRLSCLLIYEFLMLFLVGLGMRFSSEANNKIGSIIILLILFDLVAYLLLKSELEIEQMLTETRQHYYMLLEIFPEPLIVHQNRVIVYINPATLKTMGLEKKENLLGKMITECISLELEEKLKFIETKMIFNNGLNWIKDEIVRPDGRKIVVEAIAATTTYNGKDAVLIVFKSLAQRSAAKTELLEAEIKYKHLVEGALVGVYVCQNRRIVYINPRLEKICGYTQEEISKNDFMQIVVPKYRRLVLSTLDKLEQCGGEFTGEIEIIREDKTNVYLEVYAGTAIYQGAVAITGTVVDITKRKKAEEKINQMAYYDELTGLPNRRMLNNYLNLTLARASRKNKIVALMFIDLDRFKMINDTMGHSYGDLLLQKVAKMLEKSVRKYDVISRYGGDEFIIVLEDTSQKEVSTIAQRIIEEFHFPIELEGYEVFTSPSIGISIFPNDGDSPETLIKNADAAMYLAKEQGNNNYQFFNSRLNKIMTYRMKLENQLKEAVRNKEFILYFQPQKDLSSGKIVGVEALIRWQHPERGLLLPKEFIPFAEEIGLIVPINRWVLESACRQNKIWQESGLPPIKVAVNLSERQCQQPNFVKTVAQALEDSRLEPRYLELEITEDIIRNVDLIIPMMKELKKLGVQISIDDFGAGHSSLSYIRHFPIDSIKIDQSFVWDLASDFKSRAILKSIISLGHDLDLRLIAEGVEYEEQLDYLKQQKCDGIQGYYFSHPLAPRDFEKSFRGMQNL